MSDAVTHIPRRPQDGRVTAPPDATRDATCAECGDRLGEAFEACPICGRPLCHACGGLSPHAGECRAMRSLGYVRI